MPVMAADRDNARLLAQAAMFGSDDQLVAEAARWRDASPEERLAETWRLCGMIPWFQALWSDDVRERAGRPELMPADTIALLERMVAQGRAS